MKPLPKNYGAFLLGLGMKPKEKYEGFPCPAYQPASSHPEGSAMIETEEEVEAHVFGGRPLAHRTFPHRALGARVL